MKTSSIALSLVAGLIALPVLAQQPSAGDDHGAHHPQEAQVQDQTPTKSPAQSATSASAPSMDQTASPGQGGMPGRMGGSGQQGQGMMPGMMGQGGPGAMMSGMMGQGMMNCPMMQGMMGGRSVGGGMGMAQPRGDQSVGSLALHAINQRMHREMQFDYSGDVDSDFARNMLAHHRAAVDTAKIVIAFGKDPQIRQLAEGIIKAQEDEIRTLRGWLARNAKQ